MRRWGTAASSHGTAVSGTARRLGCVGQTPKAGRRGHAGPADRPGLSEPARVAQLSRGSDPVNTGIVTTPLTDYIDAAAEPAKTVLAGFRARALAIAPDAEETTSYGMPALRYRGRPLIAVITTKAGYSVYPFSPAVVTAAAALTTGLKSTKGGVTFTDERMLGDDAFDALVRGRLAEIDAA
jgi:uncharacterized protein YdhG (YjbR/CyaY superfamily)